MSHTLKPCPFCGSEPTWSEKTSVSWFQLGCNAAKCPIQPYGHVYKAAEEAIVAWNRRVPDADLVAALENSLKVMEAVRKVLRMYGDYRMSTQDLIIEQAREALRRAKEEANG